MEGADALGEFRLDAVVVGGCGHVGLPLGAVLADRGARVALYDIDERAVALVGQATMPFDEPDADKLLAAGLESGLLTVTSSPEVLSAAEVVIVVVGTPVDEHLNPDLFAVPDAVEALMAHLVDGQLLVLRSTVFPGVTDLVHKVVERSGKRIDVAFCPERIAEGKAVAELTELPQLVSGCTVAAADRAEAFFSRIANQIVRLEPQEAELAKLFTNSWRYIKFAVANQFFMIANDYGIDYERVRTALAQDYPRAKDLPSAGLAAGPCLFKDTMQLAAFNNNAFTLGHAAVMVNEGLPLDLVSSFEQNHELAGKTVGILGMAFKADSDDNRSSLSYKLKRILRFKAERVLTTDPYVANDPDLVPLDQLLAESDVLVVGAPHSVYRSIKPTVPVLDVWNLFEQGVRA
jgi:UDP-N-acetyl-D-mannosaminuronic acid dehydrogenase